MWTGHQNVIDFTILYSVINWWWALYLTVCLSWQIILYMGFFVKVLCIYKRDSSGLNGKSRNDYRYNCVTLKKLDKRTTTQLMGRPPPSSSWPLPYQRWTVIHRTEKFFTVLRRFVSPRGYLAKLISGNGTQLTAANENLRKFLNQVGAMQVSERDLWGRSPWRKQLR